MAQNYSVTMPETKHKKEVQMRAYAADESISLVRDWADKLVDEDMKAQNVSEKENLNLSIDLSAEGDWYDGHVYETTIASYDYATGAVDQIKRELNSERVLVEHQTRTDKTYNTSLSIASGQLLNEILEDSIEDNLPFSENLHPTNNRINPLQTLTVDGAGDFSENHIKFTLNKFDTERVLAKESERESDDMYETMSKVPCFGFKIKMELNDGDLIDSLTEEIIPPIHKTLSKRENIGKVRYTDCEVVTTEQGECYSI